MRAVLGQEYRELFAFLREKRRFWLLLIASALGVAVLSGVLCYTLFRSNPDAVTDAAQRIFSIFEEKDGLTDTSGALSAWGLFRNNIYATFLTAGLGIVPFLFLPGVFLTINLMIIGAVCAITTSTGTLSLAATLALIVPHGIFEIPALCLGAGCGLLLCGSLTGRIVHPHREREYFLDLLYDILRTAVLLITPLLAVAAVVEAYVTPIVGSLFVS
jgi:stage II sporulation protein M